MNYLQFNLRFLCQLLNLAHHDANVLKIKGFLESVDCILGIAYLPQLLLIVYILLIVRKDVQIHKIRHFYKKYIDSLSLFMPVFRYNYRCHFRLLGKLSVPKISIVQRLHCYYVLA